MLPRRPHRKNSSSHTHTDQNLLEKLLVQPIVMVNPATLAKVQYFKDKLRKCMHVSPTFVKLKTIYSPSLVPSRRALTRTRQRARFYFGLSHFVYRLQIQAIPMRYPCYFYIHIDIQTTETNRSFSPHELENQSNRRM